MKNISQDDIRTLKIPAYSMGRQEEFAADLGRLKTTFKQASETKEGLRQTLRSLINQIF